jgi:ABC-2 type transport system permease protein
VIAQLRSESHKLLTTRTNAGVLAALVGLISLAMILHTFGLPLDMLASGAEQRGVITDVGINLGILFSGLLGALAITAEFRTGTIRPTLLLTPRRSRVVAAKTVVALVAGGLTGLLATTVAVAVGTGGFAIRGIDVALTAGDISRIVGGGVAAGALWAVIGLGLGALARAQVPTVVGLSVWLLFVENLLGGDFTSARRFVPGSLAQSLAGSTRDGVLTSAALAAVLLVGYAAAAALTGLAATMRRDVA